MVASERVGATGATGCGFVCLVAFLFGVVFVIVVWRKWGRTSFVDGGGSARPVS